jgi:adenylate cyclase
MPLRFIKWITRRTIIVAAIGLALIAAGWRLARSLPAAGPGAPQAAFAGIDLTGLHWFARQGFLEGDASGFDPRAPGVTAIEGFPILLNTVFKIPPGNGLHNFALMTTIELDEWAASQNLLLSLAQIGPNWAVYLNGTEIRREFYLDAAGGILRYRTLQNALIAIPPRLAQAGANTLVFHFRGNAPTNPFFSGWQVGLSTTNGYRLGAAEPLIKARTLQDALSWMQTGVYFCFGLLQIFLYFRQKEIFTLYFGLFLFSCAVYSFTISNLAFDLIPDTAIINRMMWGSNFIWPGLVGVTLWSYLFPGRPFEAAMNLLVGITLVFSLGIWVAPFPWADTLLAVFLPLCVGVAIYIQAMILSAVWQRVRDARKILMSGSIIFVLILWTVLDVFIFRTGVDLIGWAPFFLAVAFALIFIERLWNTTVELTESNRQLKHMRDEMEGQVILRTRELRQANTDLEDKLAEINALQENLREQALRDALTGLFNRRFLVETLEREFALTRRQHVTSLAMIDIDHFKGLNDRYGHKAGDQVLMALSNCLVEHSA